MRRVVGGLTDDPCSGAGWPEAPPALAVDPPVLVVAPPALALVLVLGLASRVGDDSGEITTSGVSSSSDMVSK